MTFGKKVSVIAIKALYVIITFTTNKETINVITI